MDQSISTCVFHHSIRNNILINIKAHKPEKNYPMRIVVSTIGTPSYGISKYLVSFIQRTLDKNITRLKNASSLVREASNWRISSNEVQVPYDVVNLYPPVSLKEATTFILDLLSRDTELKQNTKLNINEIKLLIDLCLSKCYFLWNDEIHELKESGPIASTKLRGGGGGIPPPPNEDILPLIPPPTPLKIKMGIETKKAII